MTENGFTKHTKELKLELEFDGTYLLIPGTRLACSNGLKLKKENEDEKIY